MGEACLFDDGSESSFRNRPRKMDWNSERTAVAFSVHREMASFLPPLHEARFLWDFDDLPRP